MDIGIDLGTTFSVISIIGRVELQADYGQGRYLEECGATLIPSPFGEPTFPSVVIEDPQNRGQLLFGTAALEAADAENAPIMFSKRKMGTHEILRTGTQRFSAQEVATRFLAYLRQCVEQALGTTIERAVVTHPAYFDRVAVEQTREAAIGAGFDMDRMDQMLMEPVAAALAYTRTDKRDPLNVLTYDLGGGTFDVTVLQRRAGVIDMKAFDGDHLLGGFNFDRELVDWVRKQLETRGRKIAPDMSTDSGRAAVASLLRVAEQVKIAISQTDSDDRMVEFRARGAVKDIAGKDVPINERLSRRDFVTMIKPYLDRTLRCCLNVIKKAGIEANDIDEVLLVGGSSYGPWVKEALQPLFPNCFPRLFNPDLCVAIGAAIHASMVLPKRVSSINLSLQLDVPERSVSELISITGDVLGNIPPGMAHLEIILRRKGNEEISRVALDVRRKFFFQDVELWEAGGPNVFCIDVEDDKRKVIFTHEFVILHESDSSDTSAVTTVLPRPLFVETYDGLVRLAPEGVALPARIQSTFQRLNNNANIELKLYQGGEAIGEVRIEDIPPEGGKGALVDLQVEVTQRNQIRGKAIVRSSDGRVYAEREVTVRLQVAQIPDEASLVTELVNLKQKIEETQRLNDQQTGDHIADGVFVELDELAHEAERLLGQIPVERQEVFGLFRRISVLLQPSRDDMRPTRREFLRALADSRKALEKMEEGAKRITADPETIKGLDSSLVHSAERTIRKAEDYRKRLNHLEFVGKEAGESKDKRKWLQTYDKLTDIEAAVNKDRSREVHPTVVNKLLARRELMTLLRRFHLAAARLEADGKIADWRAELRRIHQALFDALVAITDVDDSLDDERGLAAILNIFSHQVTSLRENINQIGQDARSIGR